MYIHYTHIPCQMLHSFLEIYRNHQFDGCSKAGQKGVAFYFILSFWDVPAPVPLYLLCVVLKL